MLLSFSDSIWITRRQLAGLMLEDNGHVAMELGSFRALSSGIIDLLLKGPAEVELALACFCQLQIEVPRYAKLFLYVCMHACIYVCMHAGMRVSRYADRQVGGFVGRYGWMGGWMDRWTDVRMDGPTDGWMDRQMDGWCKDAKMERWIDG